MPEAQRSQPLSRKALWVLASAPGVTCVLVGMREPGYVDDATSMLGWEPLSDPGAALLAASEAKI